VAERLKAAVCLLAAVNVFCWSQWFSFASEKSHLQSNGQQEASRYAFLLPTFNRIGIFFSDLFGFSMRLIPKPSIVAALTPELYRVDAGISSTHNNFQGCWGLLAKDLSLMEFIP
jgi:hypothetical protein